MSMPKPARVPALRTRPVDPKLLFRHGAVKRGSRSIRVSSRSWRRSMIASSLPVMDAMLSAARHRHRNRRVPALPAATPVQPTGIITLGIRRFQFAIEYDAQILCAVRPYRIEGRRGDCQFPLLRRCHDDIIDRLPFNGEEHYLRRTRASLRLRCHSALSWNRHTTSIASSPDASTRAWFYKPVGRAVSFRVSSHSALSTSATLTCTHR